MLSRMGETDRPEADQPEVKRSSLMHIGILTGGGDVLGLNACIRSVTLSALDLGWEVTGFLRGWQGFLSVVPDNVQSVADHTRRLDREAVRGIDRDRKSTRLNSSHSRETRM